jgi:hypothetical protein
MPFWTLDLSIDGTIAVVSSQVNSSLHYAPLTLHVTAESDGAKPVVQPDSVTGSYTATFQDVPDAGVGSMSGSSVTQPALNLTRHLEFNDSSLTVVDDPSQSDQASGTIRLRGEVTLGGMQYNVNFPGIQQSGSTQAGVPLQVDIPYDPTQVTQQQTVKTKSGGMSIAGTATVTVTRAQTALQYTPLATDLVGSTGMGIVKGKLFPNRVPPFFASDPSGSSMIHGNNHIAVLLDGQDVGATYNTNRWLRERAWALGANDTHGALLFPSDGFQNDNLTGGPSWSDVPGSELTPASPPMLTLQEYLVSVKNHPEFGFLYYIVIVENRPAQYRLRMSKAWPISAQQWVQITSNPNPYRDDTNGGPFPIDSTWKTV